MDRFNKSGVSIVEVIIAISILAIFTAGTVFLMVENTRAVTQSREQTAALTFAQEAFDALYSIKYRSWVELVPGTYGLSQVPGYWILSGSQDTRAGFTRSITIIEACRCLPGYGLFSSCTLGRQGTRLCTSLFPDPETKRYTITVSWATSAGDTRTMNLSGVIAHYD